jgi:iron complex outermembrane receptor protein
MKQKLKKTICPLSYFRKLGILSLMMSFCLTVFAQSRTVTGVILDELGEPIIGANVVEKGTTNGTITDFNGNYSITVSNAQRAVLQFSFIGYTTKEESIQGKNIINVNLEPSVVNLGEVVAIGYGTQTRREITGSVANVSEENFNQGLTRDAADLLQGKVAGLTIVQGSSDVSRGSQIRLRGTSTLQNDEGPLIVIDGVPGGDMETVAPQDIESISVLKDASSAAIYGSRAAGGVILITTKRGSGNRTQVTYTGYVSVDQMANKPDLMNAEEWRAYAATKPDQDASVYDQYGANTDWFDELTRTGVSYNHNISLSGSGSNNNYRASFNYLDRNGIMRDNDLQRMNFRLQFQQRALNNRLRIGITASTTLQDVRVPYWDNFMLAYNMLPVYPVFNADGTYFIKVNDEFDQGNPVQIQDLNERKNKSVNFYGVGDIQYTIIDGLNIRTNLYTSRFMNEYSRYDNFETKPGKSAHGYAEKTNRIRERNMMEWVLDYEKAFGRNEEHKIQGMAGYSWEENKFSDTKAFNRNFLTNDLIYNNLGAGTGLMNGDVSSSANNFKLISLFARAHYSYNEKYMITATIRRDGSSKFGANHKWGMFPSVSAAWGISQESFMKDVHWINDLKLRAGYGVTGNQNGLRPYKSLQLYGTEGIYYDNGSWNAAYKINQNANPDLKWESTSMLNIGLDFTLFNNRVNGTIEWYDKKTSDMLYTYTVPTPPYVYNTIQANVGDMKNTGIEFLLNIDVFRTRDFTWTTSINLSHNKNKITRLSNELYSTGQVFTGNPWIRGGSNITSHVVEEGYPVGQFYLLECLGIDENGKYIMVDQDGDGAITESDRTYMGDAQPDLLFGWNNSFKYKNWDFSFFLRGSIGQKVLNNPVAAYANNTYLIGANALDHPYTYKLTESSRMSSLYLEDASFARLENMALGYTFDLKNNRWVKNMRVYVAAQNLFVITGYSGLDPEVELFFNSEPDANNAGLSPGIEPRQFQPKARTFTFGVNLTF